MLSDALVEARRLGATSLVAVGARCRLTVRAGALLALAARLAHPSGNENKNGKLDTTFVGYPVEEYCASRNARSAFSAPGFADAKFRYAGGALELEARMK
jgi:hypothetical protein